MSTTPPARYLPPPDHLSGNHTEPVKLPVKFRFVRNVNRRGSSPLTQRIAVYFICIAFIVVYLLSPHSSINSRYDRCWFYPPCSTTSSTTVYPYRRASRQEVPLPLSQIPPIFLYFIYHTRHMLLLCCLPIQSHSLSLSPIVIPFRYPMLP